MNQTGQTVKKTGFLLGCAAVFAAAMLFFSASAQQDRAQPLSPEDKQVLLQNLHFPSPSKEQQVGVTESILNNDPDNAVSVHFPVLGIQKVDDKIRAQVDSLLQEYQKQLREEQGRGRATGSLLVDYESYLAGDRTVSVVFHVEIDFSTLAHPDVFVRTMTFDLKDEKELTLHEALKGDYLQALADLTRKHFRENTSYAGLTEDEQFMRGTAPEDENYQSFALTDDALRLYFQKYQLFAGSYGLPYVDIPYAELKAYLNVNTTEKLAAANAAPERVLEEPAAPAAIDKSRPVVALSFDDGPNAKVTPRILDILKQNNARATFFVLGNRVDSYASILQREYEEGHEIGNHSYNHPSLTKLSVKDITYQVNETDARISQLVPVVPTLLRPPYGAVNDAVKTSVQKPLALWSIDTLDWKTRNKDAVVKEVIGKVKDGDIILMHDMYSTTADALEVILPELSKQGFQFVTVSELLAEKEITPVAGKVYRQGKS
ncbi:polysaccharide deacetylase family protein [Clostridium sp. D33t1_170424_F3]|uniref:polysaccharide deacetylase family protein n=1 Tax=Clostridium sp. D33t1_170424_F3 TaxID=2787099 RepID=UPI0018A93671|nr:polysaccharide deacetylase family protein [Clostridium sp. D33t1_170424_F3]